MTQSRDFISHLIQQLSTIPYTKSHSSIMRHASNSLSILQLLSIGATMDVRPSNTNEQSTLVEVMIAAGQ